MIRQFWRFIVLVALLSLSILGTDAQGRRAITTQRYRAAAKEIARTNPAAARRLQQEFNLPSGVVTGNTRAAELGASIRKQLQSHGFRLEAHNQGEQRLLRLKPSKESGESVSLRRFRVSDETIGRKLIATARRDEVLGKMDAKEVALLETIRRGKQVKSKLEARLEEVGVADYEAVANSFEVNCMAKEIVFLKEVTLLRVFGGESKPLGRYLFCCLENPAEAPPSIQRLEGKYNHWTDASGLATPPGNLLGELALVKLPAGTRAFIGAVADNFKDAAGSYRLGGNIQVFLPAVKSFPYERYRVAGAGSDPSDMVVQFDENRIARFRRSPDGR